MKRKILTTATCLLLSGLLAAGAAGCGPKTPTPDDENPPVTSSGRNPETDALKLAIGAVDQNFNPLFYTAQNDGEVANMTQISLVSSDVEGENPVLAYGNDQPAMALDYLETYYNAAGTAIGYGKGDGNVTGSSDVNGSTTYEFVIKKGVKDSMGYEMNVMDVLFNFYVLLDRAYTGSSTLYSTKIKGLQKYRQQDPEADDDAGEADNSQYYSLAQARIDALIEWSKDGGTEAELNADMKADLEKVKEFYMEELTSDWNTTQTSWVETYKEYTFTEEWQAFLYVEGVVQRQSYTNATGGTSYKKNEEGKYLTTLDPDDTQGGDIAHQEWIDDIAAAVGNKTGDEAVTARRDLCINTLYENNTMPAQIQNILTYNATASTALEYFMTEERSEAMGVGQGGELRVPTISGITVYKSNKLENKSDSSQTVQLDGEYDILRIEISGVDPKARWNFAVTVAPMHYYSDKEHYDAAMAAYKAGKLYDGTCTDFGVECNDVQWMSDVVAGKRKSAVPVGAGAYKAVNDNWSDITQEQIDGGRATFYSNFITRFARNDNFSTLGSGVQNAIINRIQMKVTSDDQIVSALKAGEIDYGMPTATATNQSQLNTGTLKSITYLTGGYGYVGINPKYVPDLGVRRILMHVFNTSLLINYYGQDLVNIIDRPVSSTSWASPEPGSVTRYYAQWTDINQIRSAFENTGKYYYDGSTMRDVNSNEALKFTFTLAGQTTDHPANAMFLDAARTLSQCGIEVTVQPDVTALQKLVTGDLAVWAAAWSSSIDPDPYQVYSADSQASSTKNWYKDGILQDATGEFTEEQGMVEELTQLIEEGRTTLNQNDRISIYHDCYDLIMELAVEFPTYQRYDLFVYDSSVLDRNTMTAEPSYLMSPVAELWKLAYV